MNQWICIKLYQLYCELDFGLIQHGFLDLWLCSLYNTVVRFECHHTREAQDFWFQGIYFVSETKDKKKNKGEQC